MPRRKSSQTLERPRGRDPKPVRGGRPPAAGRLPPAKEPKLWTRPAILIALGLILLTVFVYLPVRDYGFIDLDDPQYVSENPFIADGLTWDNVVWAFTSIYASYWLPLLWLSHMLDVQLFGLDAGGHHVTNLILHVLNAVLLFALLVRATGSLYPSAFVAALFALHPLHVESVVWITERKDVLSTLFWLLATWAYVSWVRGSHPLRYLLVALFFALGLMSKPMLVTLPFTLLLLDVWPLERVKLQGSGTAELREILPRLVVEKLPLLAMALIASMVTYLAQQTTGAVADVGQIPVGLRLQNAVLSYVTYVAHTFWPTGLALFYPYPERIPAWKVAISALALLAVTGFALRSLRRQPSLAVGWFWYLGTLVPVIGLVQAGTQARADRFTYVPLIGLFIAMTWSVRRLGGPLRAAQAALAALAVAAAAVLARGQVERWESKASIWEHTLAVAGESYDAHINLGIARYEEGQVDAAIAHYRDAIRVRPHGAEAHNNLGVALADRGDLDGAVQALLDGLAVNPAQGASHYNVAVLLQRKGDPAGAIPHLEAVLRLEPGHSAARAELERLRSEAQGSPAPPP